MSDEMNKAANENSEPEGVDKPEQAPESTENQTAAADDPGVSGTDPNAELRAENADLRDRLLRAVAEMENFRKRAEREKKEAAQFAISQFARDLLGVSDNMRRALDTVGGEAREAADPVFASLLEGVEMTEREFLKTLEKHGVSRIDPQGQRFDPNYHQAMFEVPDESVPSGTVVQVVQAGYKIADRCLRPAMVGVSKGGPKQAARPDGEAARTDRTA
ncbi:nucleotide exchange factor GrpE [Microbaculum marinum]|uniref:Protein GrpE n=1 Tax=Microbaculum marinum TaxID=1764581 RepID=A0AAW9RTF1_9HYPH